MVRILASVFMALLGSGLLQGAILTVGPSGTYPTINQAISASVVGQDTEIRVEGGKQYFENVLIPDSFSSGSIEMTGGWDSTFSVRDTDPHHWRHLHPRGIHHQERRGLWQWRRYPGLSSRQQGRGHYPEEHSHHRKLCESR